MSTPITMDYLGKTYKLNDDGTTLIEVNPNDPPADYVIKVNPDGSFDDVVINKTITISSVFPSDSPIRKGKEMTTTTKTRQNLTATRLKNFVAIDFETANANRGSACSVGLIRVRDGVAVDEQHWYIQPPAGIDHFDDFNIKLHGITPAMVVDAPTWGKILDRLIEYVGDDVLIAHYAEFDMSVIHNACIATGLPVPEFKSLCTVNMSRKVLDLNNYKLPTVAKACGVAKFKHHDALADSRAVVGIVQHLATYSDLKVRPTKLVSHQSSKVNYKNAVVNNVGDVVDGFILGENNVWHKLEPETEPNTDVVTDPEMGWAAALIAAFILIGVPALLLSLVFTPVVFLFSLPIIFLAAKKARDETHKNN